MSTRYPGGFITRNPVAPTSASASGIWTQDQVLQYVRSGTWPQVYVPIYIEDVFSTYLYTGNGSTQTITNGIDLSTKGGLVWLKGRSVGYNNGLFDTVRGADFLLCSNNTDPSTSVSGIPASAWITSFNSNGFGLGSNGSANNNGTTYVSWTFREQAKFFDIVTYTGNSTARTISHNLGSVPGCIIVKATSAAGYQWQVYHRSLVAGNIVWLNLTDASTASSGVFTTTAPTSTVFSLGAGSGANDNGVTYVAYLFAHDAGGFGATGTDNVISCGSYTGNGSATGPTITLGYEPQWVMIKQSSASGTNWEMVDSMRGFTVGAAGDSSLRANLPNVEVTATEYISPTATGFNVTTSGAAVNSSGATYIYIAIRRGPMKTPTSGTSVFTPVARTGTSAAATMTAGFAPDAVFLSNRNRSATNYNPFYDKLRGNNAILSSNNTGAEQDLSGSITQYTNTGITLGSDAFGNINASGGTYINWIFQRAPGFFDVVVITTNGQASPITSTHNLGVVPEMMIAKKRGPTGGVGDWMVYHKDLNGGVTPQNYRIRLNSTGGEGASSGVWNNTAPTATQFTIGTDSDVNSGTAGDTTVFYLFASVAGVSKVGSYTGTGALQTINCGFAAGARFVLIKRRDATGGDWWVYDSARGITSGNDPYLFLNSTAAEVTGTNYVDTASTGFQVTAAAPAGLNANGGTYIFLAIA